MQVAVDARIAFYNRSGIRRYLDGLLGAFRDLQGLSAEITLLKSWRDNRQSSVDLWPLSRSLFTPPHHRFEKFLLDWELRGSSYDLLHCMDFFTPTSAVPLLLTVHDLYFIKDPASVDANSRKHYSQLNEMLPQAKHVVCISQSTKNDLLELGGISPENISVIYPGYSKFSVAIDENASLPKSRPTYEFGEITLAVGTLEPRKNYEKMIQAYVASHRHLKNRLAPLVIVGRKGYLGEKVLGLIEEASKAAPIKYLGEANEAELSSLYSRASTLLYASKYEGFGFPMLEAMASRTCIITSDNSAMAEVAADSAFLVDADREESITEAIIASVENPGLREEKISLGATRLKEFSWAKAAQEHNRLYQKLDPRSF